VIQRVTLAGYNDALRTTYQGSRQRIDLKFNSTTQIQTNTHREIESPYFNDDSFSILEGEINPFQAQGHVLVCGDSNARTGQQPDTLSTKRDKHLP
jgi:hypothetical protein